MLDRLFFRLWIFVWLFRGIGCFGSSGFWILHYLFGTGFSDYRFSRIGLVFLDLASGLSLDMGSFSLLIQRCKRIRGIGNFFDQGMLLPDESGFYPTNVYEVRREADQDGRPTRGKIEEARDTGRTGRYKRKPLRVSPQRQ